MLCIAGMHIAPLECYFGYCRVEVLIFKLADFAAVHCVAPVGSEEVYIKFVGSLAYLFIGIEGDADVAMFDFGMVEEIVNSRDYLGHTGFVVGSEQGVAVGDYQVLAGVMEKFRELCR